MGMIQLEYSLERILSSGDVLSSVVNNNTHGATPLYENELFNILILSFSGVFVVLATGWSLYAVLMHLRHYTRPDRQRYIIRIMIMIPIYANCSWVSLYFRRSSWTIFIDLFRDCYEAYVIYIFFKLCVEFLGGVEGTEALMNEKPVEKHLIPCCCFTFKPGRSFYRSCLRMVIQYVVLRPTMTFCSVFLYYFGLFTEGDFSPTKGYLWIAVVNNISVCFALYYLALFYETMKIELSPHNPLLKFLCVKGIIFFTYWQSVAFAIISYYGVFGDEPEMRHYMDLVLNEGFICVEMFIAAVVHSIAFSHRPYIQTDSEMVPIGSKSWFRTIWNNTRKKLARKPDLQEVISGGKEFVEAFIDASNQTDVMKDVVISTEMDRIKLKQLIDSSEEYQEFQDELTIPERNLMDLDDKFTIPSENVLEKEQFLQTVFGDDFFEAKWKHHDAKKIQCELRVDYYNRIKVYLSEIKPNKPY